MLLSGTNQLIGGRLPGMRTKFDTTAVNWVLIVVAYAYIARFFLIWIVPESVYWTVPEMAWPAFDDSEVRDEVFYLLLVALSVFSFSVIVIRAFVIPSLSKTKLRAIFPRFPNQITIVALLLVLVLVGIFLNIVAFIYGIGRQGQFNEPLPFKLTGAIVYAKAAVVPALLLLQVYWAEASGRRRLARLGVVVLVVFGLIDMFMLDSRGAALKPILLLALVWWLAGFRFRSFDKGVLALLIVFLFGAIQMVTSVRLYGGQLEEFSINHILEGLNFILFRVTGIEQLMVILHFGSPIPWSEVWDVFTSERGIPGYYTTVLLGVDENLPQTFAPSGLGWLYLVGGLPGVIVGTAIVSLMVTTMWRTLERSFSCCAPVVKAFYLFTLLMMVSEGAMEASLISFLIVAFVLKIIDLTVKAIPLKGIESWCAPELNR